MTVKASIIPIEIIRASRLSFILSGTVSNSGNPVERDILIFKKNNYLEFVSTRSDSDGNWSATVNGGPNDKFLIICLGIEGENSEIFDWVRE